MKNWGIFIVLSVLLVLILLVSPVLAKDPDLPEKGLLLESMASLQQQIDELQAQVDDIDPDVIDGVDWSEISGIPADIADGDQNTHLTESQVDAYVADNGYVTNTQLPKFGESSGGVVSGYRYEFTSSTDGFIVAGVQADNADGAWVSVQCFYLYGSTSANNFGWNATVTVPIQKNAYCVIEFDEGSILRYYHRIPFD